MTGMGATRVGFVRFVTTLLIGVLARVGRITRLGSGGGLTLILMPGVLRGMVLLMPFILILVFVHISMFHQSFLPS
jgi:hypothetical protein